MIKYSTDTHWSWHLFSLTHATSCSLSFHFLSSWHTHTFYQHHFDTLHSSSSHARLRHAGVQMVSWSRWREWRTQFDTDTHTLSLSHSFTCVFDSLSRSLTHTPACPQAPKVALWLAGCGLRSMRGFADRWLANSCADVNASLWAFLVESQQQDGAAHRHTDSQEVHLDF